MPGSLKTSGLFRTLICEIAPVPSRQNIPAPIPPIGKAILNKEEGDEIKVVTPNGSKTFELIKLITIHDEA